MYRFNHSDISIRSRLTNLTASSITCLLLLAACGTEEPTGLSTDDEVNQQVQSASEQSALNEIESSPDPQQTTPTAKPSPPPPISARPMADPGKVQIDKVYLAQTHVLEPSDPMFKLVGNRQALLKVQVTHPDGMPSPAVEAKLKLGKKSTTLTLQGPPRLPDGFESAPGKVDHNFEDSFVAYIPSEWVQPGLQLEVLAAGKKQSASIPVGAPNVLNMKMFDFHFFGRGNNDYPEGTLEEITAKVPASEFSVQRIRNVKFKEVVIVAPRDGSAPNVRVSSPEDYKAKTGRNMNGQQSSATHLIYALSRAGGEEDLSLFYGNIIGVGAGGEAGGFKGVSYTGAGLLLHELGHALSLKHWGDYADYPYRNDMHGIKAPQVYKGAHVGPTWGFDLRTKRFIPPTVQPGAINHEVGAYKKSPMQGGGIGDQDKGFLVRHYSDYGVRMMQNYLESKLVVYRDGQWYRWNDTEKRYSQPVPATTSARYPVEMNIPVISVIATTTLSDRSVNLVYEPVGPYIGNVIRTFDPTDRKDREDAKKMYCPKKGCDFTLKIIQDKKTSYFMIPHAAEEGDNPMSMHSVKINAVNVKASAGAVSAVDLLHTPDAETFGLNGKPEVLTSYRP